MNRHENDRADRGSLVPNYQRVLLGFCRCPNTAQTMATLAYTLIDAGIDTKLLCNEIGARGATNSPKSALMIHADARQLAGPLNELNPQLIILWSGATQMDHAICELAAERDIPVRFVELGWFPQSTTVYFDNAGTNARSSIRKIDLAKRSVDPRLDHWLNTYRVERAAARPDIEHPYVFVPLQDIRDVNITLASPYQSMNTFVSALAARFPDRHFVVRPHPHYSDVWLTPRPNISVRRDLSIHPWIQHADCVVGINSTALLEALCAGKPTHSVGVGISTGLDLMYEFGRVDDISLHTEVDAARNDRIRRFLSELIFTRQTQKAELARVDRLPHIYGLSDLLRTDTSIIASPRAKNAALA